MSDLRQLERRLQDRAVLVDAGEATWPRELISAAIDGLADLGIPLRCLIGNNLSERGFVRTLAVAEEADVEITRNRLLDAVRLLGAGEPGVVIWEVNQRE